MAEDRSRPVFLARGTYRQRRLRDVSRVLPVAGAMLFALPLLWGFGTAAGGAPADVPTSRVLIYLFSVWAGLILVAALIAGLIRVGDEEDTPGAEEGTDSRSGSS